MDGMQEAIQTTNEFVCFDFLKATAHEEGGDRFIFFEASNEGIDQQGERVLSKALAESADFYRKYGNVDLDHLTITGKRSGLQDPESYEIGRPVDVSINDKSTFVKAQLYKGSAPLARNANMVWDSLTTINPPYRWYPSVGGSILAKSTKLDPETGERVSVVEKVRWSNVALSRTPVNQHVPTVSTAPFGVFSKSFGGFVFKSLTAGHGTDSATLTGGDALRVQSLDGGAFQYTQFRDALADAIGRDGRLKTYDVASLERYAMRVFGLTQEMATDYVSRFARDFETLKRSKANEL